MTAFRDQLEALRAADELRSLERPGDLSPQVIAGEALRSDGPAVRLRTDDTRVDLVAGAYGGVDQLRRRDPAPWTRLGRGLDCERGYVAVLETLTALADGATERELTYAERAATATDHSVRELGFPTPPDEAWPRLTLGLLSIVGDDGTYWVPLHGSVIDDTTLRARVPAPITDRIDAGESVTAVAGAPATALATAHVLTITDRLSRPIERRLVGSAVPVVPTGGGLVPSSSEVVLEAEVAATQPEPDVEKRAFWERLVEPATLTLDVTQTFTREDAVVPFTPLEAPLADDLQLAALSLSADLYDRVNGYWGVSPVDWVLLPAAGRLGICVVATEVLYAGFEWQLANFLFSLSNSFDTVVLVDEGTDPRNLGQVLADVWVKAHPARDWLFSEADAPVARLPRYERDGTGTRLYVDATWDPRWEEEYVAPRVSFAESFPAEVREAVRDTWSAFGFEADPDDATRE